MNEYYMQNKINNVFMPNDIIYFTIETFDKPKIRLLENIFIYAETDSQCVFKLWVAKLGKEYKKIPGCPWISAYSLVKNDAKNLYFADIEIESNSTLMCNLIRIDKNPTEIYLIQDPLIRSEYKKM